MFRGIIIDDERGGHVLSQEDADGLVAVALGLEPIIKGSVVTRLLFLDLAARPEAGQPLVLSERGKALLYRHSSAIADRLHNVMFSMQHGYDEEEA